MLVMEGGLNPEYVLDKMEQYEIKPLVANIYRKTRESWEQTRTLGYIVAQTQSTKKLTPTELLKFPWDNEESTSNTSVSNNDIERLRNKSKEYLKHINNGV